MGGAQHGKYWQARTRARMWVTLVSSIKTATMRELVHLSLCAHPNGMITNPQTHQRGLGGRGKKSEGAQKREKMWNWNIQQPLKEEINGLGFHPRPQRKIKRGERETDRQNRRHTTSKRRQKTDSTARVKKGRCQNRNGHFKPGIYAAFHIKMHLGE